MKDLKNYKILILLLIVSCVHDIILVNIFQYYGINTFKNITEYGIILNLISGLAIAPVLETYIFQFIPFKLLINIKPIRESKYFVLEYIIFSTLLFCTSHYYNWAYIFGMIFPGILLSYYFHYFFKKFNSYNTTIYFISLIHFSKNFIVLTNKYLLHNIL